MYPTLARTARISGTVEVQVTVKDGKVIKIEVKSGPQILASATTANIRSWRFYDFVSAKFATTFIYHLGEKERLNTGNPKIELELPLRVTITTGPVPVETMHGMGSGT
ncbi:MAG: energy transducer TonB [Candidatus Acidiferrales bacterium]